MAGRKSKYSSENLDTKVTKIWSVAVYIRLSQEDNDNVGDKQESNSITSQKALLNEFVVLVVVLVLAVASLSFSLLSVLTVGSGVCDTG